MRGPVSFALLAVHKEDKRLLIAYITPRDRNRFLTGNVQSFSNDNTSSCMAKELDVYQVKTKCIVFYYYHLHYLL